MAKRLWNKAAKTTGHPGASLCLFFAPLRETLPNCTGFVRFVKTLVMACQFSIPVSGSVETMLGKARAAVEKNGGTINGDTTSGSFEVSVMGTIRGNYTVTGSQININVTDKPMLVGCGMIENFLKGQMGG